MLQPIEGAALRRAEILARIAASAEAAGRAPAEVTLEAVSKPQPMERVLAMLAAGQRVFAENRVQEARARWADLRPEGLELRLIGPLQTNKAEEAVLLFDVIESLDRPKLARALAEAMARHGRRPRLLVQVNTGEEPQKAGVAPRDLEPFLELLHTELHLAPEGLMCIPPEQEEPAMHFALLAKLARRAGLPVLSMGMSGDFEKAIRFGATHVRVGSALFGARPG
ncbi:MAG: YggS family pyridoxal phosphate-dependent enzyme [Hyphomonadaceae bacterium]|nr:YggS family pyridoxal phosphate-dependent enzyme [Hyphomonadaceae bacterium]